MRTLFLLGALAATCGACKDRPPPPRPSPAPSASAAPSATVQGPLELTGSYTSEAATLFVPDGGLWRGFKFRGDTDAGALGEGTLSFEIDRKTGALSGKLEGPLGPATFTGVAQGGSLDFHVVPASSADQAFTGTGTGTLDAGVASGTIRASSRRANVLREAPFTAKAK